MQLQLVAETRVNVFWQKVQLLLEVQAWQLVIADEQATHVLFEAKYSLEVQVVQVVPLPPPIQRVQKVALVHVEQLDIAAEQDKQLVPWR